MQVTFFGATREVTGSMHLLTTPADRILLDCGLFQGRRKESEAKNRILPFDPRIVTSIVLSHAHIDHSGRIPLLVKDGFNGRIFCTRATSAACEYLLPDSAHIQESDAVYLNYKNVRSALTQMRPSVRRKMGPLGQAKTVKTLLKKNRHELDTETINAFIAKLHLEGVQPLYSTEDARAALGQFEGYPYRYPVSVGSDTTCTFYDAGHILGSAISIIQSRNTDRRLTLAFTGDLGRFGKPIIRDPTLNFEEAHRNIDLLIMESTYGDRIHDPVRDLKPRFRDVINETCNRGGTILIPAFAFGRTQELLYVLHELYAGGEVPRLPVFVDSPLATNLTRVFGEHPEVYDRNTHETFLQNGKNPFLFDQLHFVQSVKDSMALNRTKKPHIVLAASGMCEAGRILHHLRYRMHDERNTILIVGFMAQNTLGRRILEQGTAYEAAGRPSAAPVLKFLNKEYPLKAHVVNIGGFSAHGDKTEMLRFLRESNLQVKRIAVVHGEAEQSLAFAEALCSGGYSVVVPQRGETINV
jgi:metallo-beta-lactamase family protein